MHNVLIHVGKSKRDGAKVGSGRYPLGSGKRPYQGKAKELFIRANTKSIQTKKGSENITPATGIFRETENISRNASRIASRNPGKKLKNINFSDMSDNELKREINRMRLERDYEFLIADKNNVRTGREKLADILETAGDIAAIGVSVAMILGIVNDLKN